MKRNILVIICLLLIVPYLIAQQIENPGFEEWEEVLTGIEEPVDWSSIKTSDDPFVSGLAPITFEKSTDAHSGQYALKLFNFKITGLGIMVAGTMCNGQYHAVVDPDLGYAFTNPSDPQWNTPFTSRPDGIAFWMKFFPDGEDTLQFQALLHVGEGTLPPKPENEGNRVAYTRADIGGTYENWTRYLLLILTSGNGTTPIEGSYALFDDLEIIDDWQAIHDNPLDQVEIYVRENTIYINSLPKDLLKNSNLEILDLAGRIVWQSKIHSNKVSLAPTNILNGMYIVKISSADHVISRKIYF
jgi:hypothetical protein